MGWVAGPRAQSYQVAARDLNPAELSYAALDWHMMQVIEFSVNVRTVE